MTRVQTPPNQIVMHATESLTDPAVEVSTTKRRCPAGLPSTGSRAAVACLALVLLGSLLRLAAARGDLWIDEIWTLYLVSGLRSAHEVFWNISHDNNHFLNSLWMFLVGADAPSLVYRLPSIVFGTLSVGVAARIGSRSGAAAGVFTAFVFAVSFPMVNYGSEARGYGGLILAVLMAIDALDRALPLMMEERPGAATVLLDRQRWRLGLALGFGTLCHLTMVAAAGLLALVALASLSGAQSRPDPADLGRTMVRLFWPAVVLMLPAGLAVLAGMVVHHGLTIGGLSTVPGRFLIGYGGIADAALGLPATTPNWVSPLVILVALWAVRRAGLMDAPRRWMAFFGLGVIPSVVWLANPPNTDIPRYFLICGIIVSIILAEAAGRCWTDNRRRWLIAILLAAYGLGQGALDWRLLTAGRGQTSKLVATMATIPSATYAAPFASARQLPFMYYALRSGVDVRRVELPATCTEIPDWYIRDAPPDVDQDAPGNITLGPNECRTVYARFLDVPSSSLSGLRWTLFARQRD